MFTFLAWVESDRRDHQYFNKSNCNEVEIGIEGQAYKEWAFGVDSTSMQHCMDMS
jgi:hypothetical protein